MIFRGVSIILVILVLYGIIKYSIGIFMHFVVGAGLYLPGMEKWEGHSQNRPSLYRLCGLWMEFRRHKSQLSALIFFERKHNQVKINVTDGRHQDRIRLGSSLIVSRSVGS